MPSRKPEAVITRLRASNFRSIEFIDLELGRLNLFVGQNGVGKSNIVDVLRFVRDCVNRGVDQALLDRGGMSSVRRYGPLAVSSGIGIELQCTVMGYEVEYGFTLVRDRRTEYKVQEEHLRARDMKLDCTVVDLRLRKGRFIGKDVPKSFQSARSSSDLFLPKQLLFELRLEANTHTALLATFYLLSKMSFYNISPETLRGPQQIVSESPFDEKGRNLAAVLRSVKKAKGPELNDLEGALARLVDGLRAFEIHNVGSYLVTKLLYEFHGPSTTDYQSRKLGLASDLAQESDGTLRILSILAALYQQPPPELVVIEEPETNIHPGALGVIADLLQEASLRCQILVTTHNPDLIEHFEPEVLRVVEKSDGVTHAGPVAHDQQEAIRKMLFSTAEIMKMEGLRRQAVEA